MTKHYFPFLLSFSLWAGLPAVAQKKLTVQANKPVTAVPATMWGIFFEDINFGADGGLYAELVKNRSFEFSTPLMGWKELKNGGTGRVLVINEEKERPQNPRYARLTVDAPAGAYGLTNEGFRGMGIRAGEGYNFSLWARKGLGDLKLTVELVSASGKKIGSASLQGFTPDWKQHSVSLAATDTAVKGKLNIYVEGTGSIDLDQISLFPQNTWQKRPNGLRADLVQWLADLKPGFIRFPGGCIVEGRDLANRYQWKTTVGPLEDRKLIMNRWNVEFRAPRNAPDYFQTFGLGFYEYFQLSEDVGAEPLPILNCGMACQYNTGEVVAMPELDPYIQDALDLIEFANGPVSSKWGKLRSDMGHPAPFGLKYLGVGNEQWDEQYIERYREFEKILKQRHPEVKLVAAAGPAPEGPRFEYAWKQLRTLKADLVDEHYYKPPEWFLQNASRYDSYDRKGPKVFAGEYAAHGKDDARPESKNTWMSALSEAAFMTGLERNAEVVQMASYAPLLAHVEAWQWRPDLIWFDNLRSVGTPNYYVQKLFSTNKGTDVLPILAGGRPVTGQDSVYASSTFDKKTGEVIVKLVNVSGSARPYTVEITGKSPAKKATLHVLRSADRQAINTLDEPQAVQPAQRDLSLKGNAVSLALEPLSLNVVRVQVK
ncbi:alpha-L-arabinofuranosidase C-terminal domain-containing protein [Paraflavisolibacter sp. H34]|uniref:alpha-L-arabinofuranosidase C-terminal domain-containing protein n=1 Tax=Huijunlia imazamoxiresistens TaxID=3127457 RepID=UPI003015F333